MGLHPLSHGDSKGATPDPGLGGHAMTNGADKHHGSDAKKKGARKPKAKDVKATLKRKNLLPAGLNGPKKG